MILRPSEAKAGIMPTIHRIIPAQMNAFFVSRGLRPAQARWPISFAGMSPMAIERKRNQNRDPLQVNKWLTFQCSGLNKAPAAIPLALARISPTTINIPIIARMICIVSV